jgi:hypothetical protein
MYVCSMPVILRIIIEGMCTPAVGSRRIDRGRFSFNDAGELPRIPEVIYRNCPNLMWTSYTRERLSAGRQMGAVSR